MRDDENWTCPWCGRVATSVRAALCEARQCDCGALGIVALDCDWDEVTDDAINLFSVSTRPESRGFDERLRDDIRRAGIEIRRGGTDSGGTHPFGRPYVHTWFKRTD